MDEILIPSDIDKAIAQFQLAETERELEICLTRLDELLYTESRYGDS